VRTLIPVSRASVKVESTKGFFDGDIRPRGGGIVEAVGPGCRREQPAPDTRYPPGGTSGEADGFGGCGVVMLVCLSSALLHLMPVVVGT
jgi:hypothetical protein